jgi:hypothetical protein
VAVVGSTAYILDETAGLGCVDVSDPAHPALLGTLARASSVPNPRGAGAILVNGTVAYVAGLDAWGVYTVDVSDRSAPKYLSNTGSSPFGGMFFALRDNWLFAAGIDGFNVVNVSNADAPLLVVVTKGGGVFASGMVLVGNYVYLSVTSNAIGIVDVSAPLAPVNVPAYVVSGTAGTTGMVASGNVAYVGAGSNLILLDTTTPNTPSEIGRCSIGTDTSTLGTRLAVDNQVVYVASGTSGFRVIQSRLP